MLGCSLAAGPSYRVVSAQVAGSVDLSNPSILRGGLQCDAGDSAPYFRSLPLSQHWTEWLRVVRRPLTCPAMSVGGSSAITRPRLYGFASQVSSVGASRYRALDKGLAAPP